MWLEKVDDDESWRMVEPCTSGACGCQWHTSSSARALPNNAQTCTTSRQAQQHHAIVSLAPLRHPLSWSVCEASLNLCLLNNTGPWATQCVDALHAPPGSMLARVDAPGASHARLLLGCPPLMEHQRSCTQGPLPAKSRKSAPPPRAGFTRGRYAVAPHYAIRLHATTLYE